MFKLLSLTLTLIASFALLACAATPPRAEFDNTKRIQEIALTNHEHVFAQNDLVLTQESLDGKLSLMNPDWQHDLKRARWARGVAVASFITQVVALAICVGQNNLANVVGWCGGSVAMGFVTIGSAVRSDNLDTGVIRQYNHKYQSEFQH